MHTDAPPQGDPIRIDWSNACVWRGGAAVPLTPKAWAVLRTLTAQAGQLVPKAALLEAVWPETVVSEAVLTECIRELRQAFGETARTPRWIQTVHRRGYRFLGPPPGPGPGAWEASVATPATPASGGAPASRALEAAFVGREAELAQLHMRLAQARGGARQVVFITGEPGIGKTTLVQAFVAHIVATGGVWIAQGQCLNHAGAGEAYLPVLEALGRLCRAPGGAACLAMLDQHAPMWLAQLPALLSPTALEAVQRRVLGATRARMLRELTDALDTLTQAHPLVLVLEDVHWSDAATLDLLAALAQRPEPARLLVLCTYRPVEVIVRQHPLKALEQALEVHRQCTELPLEWLSAAEVAQYLAARFAMAEPLAAPFAAFARTLHQRTDGHPLFLVIMVDDLVRQGLVRPEAGQWVVEDGSTAALLREVPASLRRLLAQWYDELPAPDQQVLDAASVAGLTWSSAAVAAGLGVDVEAVEVRCAALARRGQWLEAQGLETWPDGTVAERYRWQHTLYQEVVYEHVPAGQRVRLHRRLGSWLAVGYGVQAGAHAAMLADHFVHGHDAPQAVPYLRQAAQQALHRHGYQEAIAHLTRGLELLPALPDTPERVQQELAIQVILGVALMPLKGYAAPEVERAYMRAWALCQQVEETPQRFQLLWGLWVCYFVRGELQTGRALGEQLLDLAHRAHAPGLLLEAHLALGASLRQLGELVAARAHLEQSMVLYDPQQHSAHAVLYGQDPGVASLSDAAATLWLLGYPDQAVQRGHEALTLARALGHPFSIVFALIFVACLQQYRREGPAVHAQAEAAMTLATDQGFAIWWGIGAVLGGWALAEQGQQEAGMVQMRRGVAARLATGAKLFRPYFLALLAEAYGKAGQAEEGLRTLAEALVIVHHTGEHWWEAELYRLQGELLLADAGHICTEAEACFHQALAIARRQEAKALELRAAMSLSRLWQQQGKRAEARELLAPIYDWFTEGFDTADLQEAKALLAELGG